MVKRRTFIVGGAATLGALVVGWSALPPRQRLMPSQPPGVQPGQTALNGWVKIGADNRVTVMVCRAEMGQGVHTGLAMLVAEELDADWSRVGVEAAPVDRIYNNVESVISDLPFRPDDDSALKGLVAWLARKGARDVGAMMTGGSTSLNDAWLPMREAGATARAMLIEAAATQWGVPLEQCHTEAGRVFDGPVSGATRSATYGELAPLAASQPLPRKVELKDPAAFRLIGKPLLRIEAPSKLDGSARFGIDAAPDGLLYASVAMCPVLGGAVAHFDGAAAAAQPGVRSVFAVAPYHGGTGGVAVIADNVFAAMQAAAIVKCAWHIDDDARVSSADVLQRLADALDDSAGHTWYARGDADAALGIAARVVKAEYRVPYLAHAALEPINCTAQVNDGAAIVWAATQVPDVARRITAQLLGLPDDKVEVRQHLIGGAFGRRLEMDFIAQAVAIANTVRGTPVQTVWTRPQDMMHDFYRPACVSRFSAGLNDAGAVIAWRNISASQSLVTSWLARNYGVPSFAAALGRAFDKTNDEGAFDQPYEWLNVHVGHKPVALPVPVGFWRSVGHSHQAFFVESFIDELAAAARKDPISYRAAMLAHHPRHLAVLRRVAQLAGWHAPLDNDERGLAQARGVALHEAFGSVVGQVVEVSVEADKARTIHVNRVVCVIDCGLPVNPNLIAQQLEGAIVFGLSAALYEEITLEGGSVQQQYFSDYPVVRMEQCPRILTDIMSSREHPQGVGEAATPPVAPAVANAIFALTGQRIRTLPLKLA
ncbi:xanthine dehydrogenase family protein molybdopterin-binding subunit [Paraburkholderia humisilvae]|uniref:Isoquinoline 1-oxidoreductase subunit beta n=1 Tax=Paraburkholderia humisilvae TaxID=627669 RepID=A0A6J5EKK6_9BURK|nr:molybdopterin cofactor-binding domain-containing protein [Paraburkholderia humisilvae]CAB3766793.1 Isoquinoline 1-oxidoreductase subunit beta [Paraburkholderia humisilvae]